MVSFAIIRFDVSILCYLGVRLPARRLETIHCDDL